MSVCDLLLGQQVLTVVSVDRDWRAMRCTLGGKVVTCLGNCEGSSNHRSFSVAPLFNDGCTHETSPDVWTSDKNVSKSPTAKKH